MRESQPERCAPRGRPGAECEERQRSAEPGRRGGVERARRFTVGTAAAAETAAAGEPAELPSSRPLLSRRRTPRENPIQAAGWGLGGALTSPPLPHLLQARGSGERGSDPPQLPAATPKLGGSLPGQVLTNLVSLRPSL